MKRNAFTTLTAVKTIFLLGALLSGGIQLVQSQTAANQIRQWTPNAPTTTSNYIGGQACAECHQSKSKAHSASAMAQALFAPADNQIFRAHPQLSFRNGPWTYQIKREGERSIYTVSDGKSSYSEPVLWCFGLGHSGQTYVIRHEGAYYETRVSFFSRTQSLDFTPGAPRNIPANLSDAIGQRLSKPDTMACFNCHSTVAPAASRFDLEKFTPGIGCETCHGPGEKHVATMKANKDAEVADKLIFNPRRMHPDDLSQQFCGACHRSWETVMQMSERGGASNVRFQPYRLANSKCYKDPDNRRISCSACHDAHEDPKREARFYDAKCTACHQVKGGSAAKTQTAPACPTGKTQCVTCHMPKIEPPGLHFNFTDHHIRVVKPGEDHPR
ncbi:MAG TPA: multiheme c-type cytochrome [Blastocatellia bacterium]|nr:multiheme c-type cytochrome [Blastocatellia bacterium]HMY73933.1 multiheme c-type cytochrome [Blastocatellia bacterium]HMZ21846.1 multiheme c-type cytochrome [Blastocatellia bacterium]HNG30332.1 multiheme c-type cytochrome [Blastocatellia bacterium]